jgi:hypothetical protein
VDWIGIDTYQSLTPDPTGTFAFDISPWYTDYTAPQFAGKPLIVGENGAPKFSVNVNNAEQQWPYLHDATTGVWSDFGGNGAVMNSFPAIKAYDWFDEGNSLLDDPGPPDHQGGMLAMADMGGDTSIFFHNSLNVAAPDPTKLVSGTTYAPPLTLTNNGVMPLTGVQITSIGAITVVHGTGSVSLNTALPVSVPILAAGQTVRPSLVFTWPATASCIAVPFHYTATRSDGQGSTTSYTGSNTVNIARKPGAACP